MRRLFTLLLASVVTSCFAQQGPGLIISEILPNPAGTDSPFELVELVATRTINFASTPYTVIAANNGSANTQGWIAGGSVSYAFQISSGTVNAGDVVYVGGSSMTTTGTVLRGINTGTTPGDGFGTQNSGGVVGNGGSNADAIGVFNLAVASITNSTAPVDAVFYGSAMGTAVVNAGADGYQLPVNDLYRGGKLQSTDLLAPDPASAQYVVASGAFNPATGAFTTARTWTLTTTFTDGTTGITLGAVSSPSLSLTGTHMFVSENAGTVNVTVNVTGPNNGQAVFTLSGYTFSTASAADYTSVTTTLAAGVSGAQVITIPVANDAMAEKDEYIALTFTSLYNATASATAVYYIYIKDDDTPAPVATNELFLDSVSTFQNGAAGSNSAEIVTFDPAVNRLYIANSVGAKLDIVNFSNPANPTLITSLNISSYGNLNSVVAHDSVVALAIENNTNPQDSGKIVFLDYNGAFISQVKVGAMPDMITFNHAGNKVLTACEGEPNAAYTNDPDGSVCVVDISGGVANVTQANVSFITFTAYNGQEAALRAQGIRIYGVSGIASKDFEPEFITIADNDSLCWVTLQENNAIAQINLVTNTVMQLMPLGYKNFSTGANALDASDQTTGIALMQAPVFGMYQPDAISQYSVNNQVYLLTANEGDARAYSGLNEEARINSLTLDPVAFPFATQMKQNTFMGRINVTNRMGDTDNDGDFDQLYMYGARSFSIWNGTSGAQVYDSNDQLERITSTHPVYSPLFNMSNGMGTGTAKNRSDDKGPEAEGSAVASINGDHFAFIALERIGGVMMYNITNPSMPAYTGYYNHRTITGGPDRGAEGIIFIPDSLSPNGSPLVIVANEVSSTLSVFQVTTCAERAGVTVVASATSACAGDTVTLSAATVAGTSYQWMMNGTVLPGETATALNVTAAGEYQLMITNSTHACSGKTPLINVEINPVPVVNSSASVSTVCSGTTVTLTGSGAAVYNWSPGNLNGTAVSVTPVTTTTYVVTGTLAGCSDTSSVVINVLARPAVTASSPVNTVCNGTPANLTANGAATYNWMPVNINGSAVSVTPSSTTSYTVTGTAANGCTNTAVFTITVVPTPTVTASVNTPAVCSGNTVTLQGTGTATANWVWFPGMMTGQNVTTVPNATTTYTLTGYHANGCTQTSTVNVTVNPSPALVTSGTTVICEGASTTLGVNGAASYNWSPGNISSNTITVAPNSSSTYSVTGTGANGCMDSTTVMVTVNANPVATLTAANDSACNNDALITLNGTPAGGVYFGSSVNGNMFDPSAAPIGANAITYVYTDGNGCSDTSGATILVDICLGIDNAVLTTLNAYPNPFTDVLTLTSGEVMEQVQVYDALGQLVLQQNVQSDKCMLDLAGYESGIYFVNVIGRNGIQKVIVTKM